MEAHGREGSEHPGQLGYFGHIGLAEEESFLGVQPAREKIQRNVEGVLAALLGVEERGHGMIIGDEIKCLAPFLQLDGGPHHPEIVAEMERARGLDA